MTDLLFCGSLSVRKHNEAAARGGSFAGIHNAKEQGRAEEVSNARISRMNEAFHGARV